MRTDTHIYMLTYRLCKTHTHTHIHLQTFIHTYAHVHSATVGCDYEKQVGTVNVFAIEAGKRGCSFKLEKKRREVQWKHI